MKLFTSLLLLLNFLIMNAQKSVHEFEILTIDGEKKSLSSFKGKKMLFVNTASECGFTPQYEELQKLHLMSNKVSVKGKNIDPMFNWLNQQENESFRGDIMWNFEKYLIDEDGVLIKRFRSTTKPNSSSITTLI